MRIIAEPLRGTYLISPVVFKDNRGEFIKTYNYEIFSSLGILFNPVEEFFSASKLGVIRGMHYQRPPYDHNKLVYCVKGRVLDVLLDLRTSSSTFGQVATAELSDGNRHQFFVPRGVVHGFLSLSDDSIMVYKTDVGYAPQFDSGIRWNSFGFDWGVVDPVVSERDRALPGFDDFKEGLE